MSPLCHRTYPRKKFRFIKCAKFLCIYSSLLFWQIIYYKTTYSSCVCLMIIRLILFVHYRCADGFVCNMVSLYLKGKGVVRPPRVYRFKAWNKDDVHISIIIVLTDHILQKLAFVIVNVCITVWVCFNIKYV